MNGLASYMRSRKEKTVTNMGGTPIIDNFFEGYFHSRKGFTFVFDLIHGWNVDSVCAKEECVFSIDFFKYQTDTVLVPRQSKSRLVGHINVLQVSALFGVQPYSASQ